MTSNKFHPAATRGNTNIGWLNGYHSISAAHYYDPERLAFGALLVLNDDTVLPGKGFGTHRHQNMEIISIPLSGAVTHKDSTGKEETIRTGDVQMMSAGSGIAHSEYNASATEPVNFLQIWIAPNQQNVTPRYQQIALANKAENTFHQIVSPNPNDEGLWLHQQAWLHKGIFSPNTRATYSLKQKGNGVYLLVLSGKVELDGKTLEQKDAMEIRDADKLEITVKEKAEILLIEVSV